MQYSQTILILVLMAFGCSDEKKDQSGSPFAAAATENVEEPSESGNSEYVSDINMSECYKGDAFICEIERIITVETNKLRATSGKAALTDAKDHSFISRSWSEEMAANSRIGHEGFPAERRSAYEEEFGKDAKYFAENVAMLSDSGDDAEKIAKKFVTMWWTSAGHKANMLGNHKNLGSGVAKNGKAFYATQLFN